MSISEEDPHVDYLIHERNTNMDPFVLITRIDDSLLQAYQRADNVENPKSSTDKVVNDVDRQHESSTEHGGTLYPIEANNEARLDHSYCDRENSRDCDRSLSDSSSNIAICASGKEEAYLSNHASGKNEGYVRLQERSIENSLPSPSPSNLLFVEPWNNIEFMKIDFTQENEDTSDNFVLELPDFETDTPVTTVTPVERSDDESFICSTIAFRSCDNENNTIQNCNAIVSEAHNSHVQKITESENSSNSITSDPTITVSEENTKNGITEDKLLVSKARILRWNNKIITKSQKSKIKVSKKRKRLNYQPAIHSKVQKGYLIRKPKTSKKRLAKKRKTVVSTAVEDELGTSYLKPQVSLNDTFILGQECQGPITRSKSQIVGLKQFPLPKECMKYLSTDEESDSSLESFSSTSSYERDAIRQLINETLDNVTESTEVLVQKPIGVLNKLKKATLKGDNNTVKTIKRKLPLRKDNSSTNLKRGAIQRDRKNRFITGASCFHNNTRTLEQIGQATISQSVAMETRNLKEKSLPQTTDVKGCIPYLQKNLLNRLKRNENSIDIPHVDIATPSIEDQCYGTTSVVPEFILGSALELEVEALKPQMASKYIQPESERLLQIASVNRKLVIDEAPKAFQKKENLIKDIKFEHGWEVIEICSSDDEPEIIETTDQMFSKSVRKPFDIPTVNCALVNPAVEFQKQFQTRSYPTYNSIASSSARIVQVNHNDAGCMLSKYISEHLLLMKSTNDHRTTEASMEKMTNLCLVYFNVCEIPQFQFKRLLQCIYHYLNEVHNVKISVKDLIILLGDVGRRINESRRNDFIDEFYRGYYEAYATIIQNVNLQHDFSTPCRSGPSEEQSFIMLQEHKNQLSRQISDYLRLCGNSQMPSDNQYVPPVSFPPNYALKLLNQNFSNCEIPDLSDSMQQSKSPEPEEAVLLISNADSTIGPPLVRPLELPSTVNLSNLYHPAVHAVCGGSFNEITTPISVPFKSPQYENVGNEVTDADLLF